MSARQPFVPSRSVSTAAPRDAASAVSNASQEFIADASNPLHSRDVVESLKPGHVDKPLNLGKFLQKSDTAHRGHSSQTHLVSHGDNTDSDTVDIFTNSGGACDVPVGAAMTRAQTPHIIAPTPRLRSSTPAMALSLDHSVFKAPELPSASFRARSNSQVGRKGMNAHTFSHPDLSGPHSHDGLANGTSQPHVHHSEHVNGLGSMHDQTKDEHPGFKEDDPVRVPFDSRPRIFGRRRTLENAAALEDATSDAAVSMSTRKRARADENDESGDGRIYLNKRYKYASESAGLRDDGHWKTSAVSEPVASPDHHPNYHRASDLGLHGSQQHLHRGNTLPLSPPSNQGQRHADIRNVQHSEPALPLESIWERLLGEDAESYITEQAEAIEKARKRWEEATYGEWVAGADELAQMFAKILDLARDHMLSKMKLYTTFNEKIDAHNVTLKEQERFLTRFREKATGATTRVVEEMD